MGLLEDGLKELGFRKTTSVVGGYNKDFWLKDNYVFFGKEVGTYGIVKGWKGGQEQRFRTRKRLPDRHDAEILNKLTEWLKNPTF